MISQIYRHVFEPADVIKPSASAASFGIAKDSAFFVDNYIPPEVSLDTSILTTNKAIYNEAIKVLYDEKIIRGTVVDFNNLLQNTDFKNNVRHIDVADCVSEQLPSLRGMIKTLDLLPRVRSVFVLSDCLGCTGFNSPAAPHISAQEFFVGFGRLIPVEVGRYQLPDEFRNVQIVNRKLVEMWPSVESTPDDYDPLQEYAQLIDQYGIHEDMIAWVLQTSFRCWVGLHNQLLVHASSGRLLELQDKLNQGSSSPGRNDLTLFKWYATSTRPHEFSALDIIADALSASPHSSAPKWAPLRNCMEGDDVESLAWVTEYLSVNIAGFRRLYGDHIVRPSHWAEADGGLQTVEWKAEWQQRTLEGDINRHYIQQPVRKDKLFDCRIAQIWARQALGDTQLMGSRLETEPSPLEVKQLAYLYLARQQDLRQEFRGMRFDEQNLDKWALGLLRRYISASGLIHEEHLEWASLEDLRGCLRLTLAARRESEVREEDIRQIKTPPPEGLSEDLYLPLAWRFGPQLVHFFEIIFRAGGMDKFLAKARQEAAMTGAGEDVEDQENDGEDGGEEDVQDDQNDDDDDGNDADNDDGDNKDDSEYGAGDQGTVDGAAGDV